jgi:cold shock CspA family protein
MDTRQRRTGTVTSFDEPVGLGELRDDDGSSWPFHCTAIADGTRDIAVGARVDFVVRHGRLGRWEAADLRPTAGAVRPPIVP